MEKQNDIILQQWERIIDSMVDDILNLSEEEVKAEIQSDYGDPKQQAQEVFETLRSAILNSGVKDRETIKKLYKDINITEFKGNLRSIKSSEVKTDFNRPLQMAAKGFKNQSNSGSSKRSASSLIDNQLRNKLNNKKK